VRSSIFEARTILPGFRIEAVLHGLEDLERLAAVHLLVELGAHQPVAVFARVRAFVFPHHRERLFRNGAHGARVFLQLEIEDRAHVQAADGGVRIPRALGAVLLEHGGEALGVIGEVLQRHRAILDEGDRLSLALHRHHDVEAGRAYAPDRALPGCVGDFHDACGIAEVAHQFVELGEAAHVLRLLVFREFNKQQRIRLAAHVGLHHRAEHGDVAGEFDQCAIHHLHRDGTELDDVLGRLHRLPEGGEMADAERLVLRKRREFQLDLP
jgi:hypothetical protein